MSGRRQWPNRDPIGELGFRKLARRIRGTLNRVRLYTYVQNGPINKLDAFGLAVWVCTRRTVGFPFDGFGRHAYLWDDRSPISRHSCGMEGSSGSDETSEETDAGPIGNGSTVPGSIVDDDYYTDGDTECTQVPGSEGNESGIMNHCRECVNPVIGPIPFVTDCQKRCDKMLGDQGYPIPPHRRWNDDDTDHWIWRLIMGGGVENIR